MKLIVTEEFSKRITIHPEDRSLHITENTEVPQEYLELWYRFCSLSWNNTVGAECMTMSLLLRRIMRIHGFPAVIKQTICEYKNDRKNWYLTIGKPLDGSFSQAEGLDTHMVVESNGLILDFSHIGTFYSYGATAPMAVIAKNVPGFQSLGNGSYIKYLERPTHRETANQIYLTRNEILEKAQEYFSIYRR